MASPALQPATPQRGGTHFQPSAAQRKLLEVLRNEEPAASIRDLCGQAGVSPTSLYRWQRNPAFRRWMAADLANHLFCSSAILVTGSFNAALNGDDRMALAMLKFTLNPKGLAAYSAYLTNPPAPAVAPGESATDPGPDPDPEPASAAGPDTGAAPDLPPPVGVMSSTYRLLKQARRLTASSYLTARRAVLFHRYMEEIAGYAAAEAAQASAVEAAPPAPALTTPEP